MRLRETVKYATYRTPVLNRLMAPSYPYKLDPGEICAMIGFIDATRGSGAAVAEIGVAQGDTSVFLLEHLKTTQDDRTLLLFDTFDGFTDESLNHEIHVRGKAKPDVNGFRYGDEARFKANLHRLDYQQFRTIKGDASAFDWDSLGPIGAVILDIDLYQPTASILNSIYPNLLPGGGIVVDDCVPGIAWDGALQAYEEFTQAKGLPFERVGQMGAIIRK